MSTSSPASRIQENLQQLFQGNSTLGNPYIKFQLTPEITALLSMEQVQETLIVEAGQITPLPSMPQSNIGIMNSRDRVFCVFDLAQLLNLPARLFTPRQYQIIVLQTTGSTSIHFGLIVNNIQGIMRLSPEQIHAPTEDITSNLLAYTSGVVTLEENAIAILGFEHIFKAITSA